MMLEKLRASFQRAIHEAYPQSLVDVIFVPHTDPKRGDLWTDVAFRLSEENKLPLDGVSESLSKQIVPPAGTVVTSDRGYLNIVLEEGPDPSFASQWEGDKVAIVGIPFVSGLSGDAYIRAQARVLSQVLFALAAGKSVEWFVPGAMKQPELLAPGNLRWVDDVWAQVRADGKSGTPQGAASLWSRALHDLYVSSGGSLPRAMTSLWLVPSVLDQGLVTQIKVRVKSMRNISLPMFSLRQLGKWGGSSVSEEKGSTGRSLLLYLASSLSPDDVDTLTISRNERAHLLWYLAMTRERVEQWRMKTEHNPMVPRFRGQQIPELHRRLGWLPVHLHRALMCGAVDDFLLYLDESLALIHRELNTPSVRSTWDQGKISEDHREILWLAHEFLCDRIWNSIVDT